MPHLTPAAVLAASALLAGCYSSPHVAIRNSTDSHLRIGVCRPKQPVLFYPLPNSRYWAWIEPGTVWNPTRADELTAGSAPVARAVCYCRGNRLYIGYGDSWYSAAVGDGDFTVVVSSNALQLRGRRDTVIVLDPGTRDEAHEHIWLTRQWQ